MKTILLFLWSVLLLCGNLSYGQLPPMPPMDNHPSKVKTNEPPQIKIDKKDIRNLVRKTGTSAYFEISAKAPKKSNNKLYYQWYCNGRPVTGETNKSITIKNIQYKQHQGVYSVTVSTGYTVTNTPVVSALPKPIETRSRSESQLATIVSSTNTIFTLTVIDTNILSTCYTTNNSVSLAWDPSPDPFAVGYIIYYRTISNQYNAHIDVGAVTNTILNFLTNNITYYFVATAYSIVGLESIFSNEVSYKVPPKISPVLSIMLLTDGTPQVMSKVCSLMPYTMLWTTNLISWTSLITTNADEWGNIIVPDNNPNRGPSRFYRLRLN